MLNSSKIFFGVETNETYSYNRDSLHYVVLMVHNRGSVFGDIKMYVFIFA